MFMKSEKYIEFKGNVNTKDQRKESERLDSPTENIKVCRLKSGHKYRQSRAL